LVEYTDLPQDSKKMKSIPLDLEASADHAIVWQNDRLYLLDQRVLPAEESYLELQTAEATADAIRDMVVRGAPAIGITAAFGVVLAARNCFAASPDSWREDMAKPLAILKASRPTAMLKQ
jgi:methylthioribose-1-phosphate isomerase